MADSWESLVRHARDSRLAYITAVTRLNVVAMADEIGRLRAVNAELVEVCRDLLRVTGLAECYAYPSVAITIDVIKHKAHAALAAAEERS